MIRLGFGLPETTGESSSYLVVNENKSEDKELAAELQCVLDRCMYPKTCRWNERCMEEGMGASKEAQMEREKIISSDREEDIEAQASR